jgi:anti-anti-sigma factor
MDAMSSSVLSVDVAIPGSFVSHDRGRTVVWLEGEHDIATQSALNATLADAISADQSDVVVDLSGVTFMAGATIDELVRGRAVLQIQCRSLTVRSPSRCARRLLDLCGLTDLVEYN